MMMRTLRDKISALLATLLLSLSPVSSLKISCGTRGASVDFQFPDSSLLRELNCVCDESRGDDDDDDDSAVMMMMNVMMMTVEV